jgi:hypothetical protein
MSKLVSLATSYSDPTLVLLLQHTHIYFVQDAPQKLISAQSVYLSLSLSLYSTSDMCNVNNFCVCEKKTIFFTVFLYQIECDYLI